MKIACIGSGGYDAQMTNISKRQWCIGAAACLVTAFFSAGFTCALLKNGFGSSEVAGWVQAIGATIGIGIAIWVPLQQRVETVREGKLRSFHHTMAIVNDLRGQVTYLKAIYEEGDRPLAALTTTTSTLLRRFEALYDRDLYAYLPGPIVDRITGMSGSFNGIEASVAFKASELQNDLHATLSPHGSWAHGSDPFESLYNDLDNLFTALKDEADLIRV
jgi:hypothetical protein